MKKLDLYGIKTFTLNDTVIHTFKIRVKNTPFNSNALTQSGFKFVIQLNGYLVVSDTSLDEKYFNNQVSKLGKVLKAISLNNVEEKYYWVNQPSLFKDI